MSQALIELRKLAVAISQGEVVAEQRFSSRGGR